MGLFVRKSKQGGSTSSTSPPAAADPPRGAHPFAAEIESMTPKQKAMLDNYVVNRWDVNHFTRIDDAHATTHRMLDNYVVNR